MKCRSCSSNKLSKFLDLGQAPPSNSYISKQNLKFEKYYPLQVFICKTCFFVQTKDFLKSKDFFDKNYAYFSGYSKTYKDHCSEYKKKIIKTFKLNKEFHTIYEIASNDGTMLKNFFYSGYKCIGIEPTKSTAENSKKIGINTIVDFFGYKLSKKLQRKYKKAKLIISNNVLAHVPDLNDFLNGYYNLLDDEGLITFEFPHLLNLIKFKQFDTIYHEHYSYLSIISLDKLMKRKKLKIFKVEKLPKIHGGSLRVYVTKNNNKKFAVDNSVKKIISEEKKFGLNNIETFYKFKSKVESISKNFTNFVQKNIKQNKNIYGYGAAAKTNTFLNYLKLNKKHIKGIFDLNNEKIGKLMPGSHIKILNARKINNYKIDTLIIFVWNLEKEIFLYLKKKLKKKIKIFIAVPKIRSL